MQKIQKKESSRLLTPVICSILVTETGERFAYFGFRAVLVLYFTQALQFDDNRAIAYFAYTTCLAYLSPLAGSLIADGGLGRYKTILYFGVLYVVGLVILTIAAWAPGMDLASQRFFSFLGLFFVCIGTGGIKPCVSAFGADQVSHPRDKSADQDATAAHLDNQAESAFMHADPLEAEHAGTVDTSSRSELVRKFFAYFYFCINLGALTSIAIVPILRGNYGFDIAFLVPTCFMVIAMALFLSKRKEYVHHVPGEDGSSLFTTCRLVVWLIRSQLSQSLPWIRPPPFQRHGHQPLPDSSEREGEDITNSDSVWQQQLDDASQALHVLPIMGMLPIFWCLYDQQGSVWTLQAGRMDLHFLWFELQPEQLTVINPLEIMLLIPLFDSVIYPAMQNHRWEIRPLRRMSWGMILTAVSFFFSGLVEQAIRSREEQGLSQVHVMWQLPQLTILSVGEIFLSVTGLEFAYSVSPERLRAFIMGIYLLTTAVGDLLGGVLYSTVFTDMERANIMFSCAILMLVNLGFFYRVAAWYEQTDFRSLRRIPSQDEGVEFQDLPLNRESRGQ